MQNIHSKQFLILRGGAGGPAWFFCGNFSLILSLSFISHRHRSVLSSGLMIHKNGRHISLRTNYSLAKIDAQLLQSFLRDLLREASKSQEVTEDKLIEYTDTMVSSDLRKQTPAGIGLDLIQTLQKAQRNRGFSALTKAISLGHFTISTSYTNLDKKSASEPQPSFDFKISTTHQHQNIDQIPTWKSQLKFSFKSCSDLVLKVWAKI